MKPTLESIRGCLEGVIPATLATCAADGTPNVTYVSQIHFVDCQHVGLSFQFFNKTRENVLANPQVTIYVMDPNTAGRYRLAMQYLRTESTGPVFESMKARLAGIASHTGMSGVFRLQGADIYRVLDIEHVPGAEVVPPPSPNRLMALRGLCQQMGEATDLETLLDQTLDTLQRYFAIPYLMLLMQDAAGERLYTVASRGYEASGVGSEILLGEGVIGVAAQQRTPIRITHMTHEYSYSRAIRERVRDSELADQLETEIPFPGLAEPHSQLALPLMAGARVVGGLYVESPEDLYFGYEDEDALSIVARQLGAAIVLLQQSNECVAEEAPANKVVPQVNNGAPLLIRRFISNNSIFIGDDYLIKGVAGAIFWKMVCDFYRDGRTEFSNRELRLDPSIRLPDIDDNLEARLILLQRRLAERLTAITIRKTGRGRFSLLIQHPIQLAEV